jgi:hypothetical protein
MFVVIFFPGNNYGAPQAYTDCISKATGGNINPDNYQAALQCEKDHGEGNVSAGTPQLHRRHDLVIPCASTHATAAVLSQSCAVLHKHTTQLHCPPDVMRLSLTTHMTVNSLEGLAWLGASDQAELQART